MGKTPENLKKKSGKARGLTTEEAREIGRKGGKASVESRRRRKTLKEELELMLANPELQQSMCTALLREALYGNSTGSVTKAFETIRDTIGEKPTDKVQMDGGIRFTFADGDEDYSG